MKHNIIIDLNDPDLLLFRKMENGELKPLNDSALKHTCLCNCKNSN